MVSQRLPDVALDCAPWAMLALCAVRWAASPSMEWAMAVLCIGIHMVVHARRTTVERGANAIQGSSMRAECLTPQAPEGGKPAKPVSEASATGKLPAGLGRKRSQLEAPLMHFKTAPLREGESYPGDPVRWSFIPSTGVFPTHVLRSTETEFGTGKFYYMSRPTHDKARDKAKDYPSAWHLGGRRRCWELRVQLQFTKKLPDKQIIFALTQTEYKNPGFAVRKMMDAMTVSARMVLNYLYVTPGDDPAQMPEGSEAEPGTTACSLEAMDQVIASEAGSEPDITGDLEGLGSLRGESLAQHRRAVEELCAPENLRQDIVYTFCFWGTARMLEVNDWQFVSSAGWRVNLNTLVGAPPIRCSLYVLEDGTPGEERHLVSRKRYILDWAFWSKRQPPQKARLQEIIQHSGGDPLLEEDYAGEGRTWLDFVTQPLTCCSAR